jgi:DNA-binding NarL/FixJ family response regulator
MTHRLLVVDDDPDYRFLVRTALRTDAAVEVVGEAASAAAAIDKATELQPDLILLDVVMPRTDGLAAVPAIRAAAPEAIVILASALRTADLPPLHGHGRALGYLGKDTGPLRLGAELMMLAGALAVVEEGVRQATTNLAQDLQSPSAGRRFVHETLTRWTCDELMDTVGLLVSELVTNAVIHAHSPADVSVRLAGDSLRVEVRDGSDQPVLRRTVPDDAVGGRGLTLVETMARRWGTYPLPGGKVVWFEVDRPDSNGAAGGRSDGAPPR